MSRIRRELGSTDNESTAGRFIKLFLRWSTHVNLKSHGNKILFFVASFSRNHYRKTVGWDCLELNLMRFVRIDVCKIQLQFFWDSNSILNGFSRISPKHHGKRFFSRGFSHLSVPPQFLLFLTLFLLYCHPAFQISQCQCNRGSFSGSYPHAFVSQEIVIIIIIAIRKVLRLLSVSVLSQEYGE